MLQHTKHNHPPLQVKSLLVCSSPRSFGTRDLIASLNLSTAPPRKTLSQQGAEPRRPNHGSSKSFSSPHRSETRGMSYSYSQRSSHQSGVPPSRSASIARNYPRPQTSLAERNPSTRPKTSMGMRSGPDGGQSLGKRKSRNGADIFSLLPQNPTTAEGTVPHGSSDNQRKPLAEVSSSLPHTPNPHQLIYPPHTPSTSLPCLKPPSLVPTPSSQKILPKRDYFLSTSPLKSAEADGLERLLSIATTAIYFARFFKKIPQQSPSKQTPFLTRYSQVRAAWDPDAKSEDLDVMFNKFVEYFGHVSNDSAGLKEAVDLYRNRGRS